MPEIHVTLLGRFAVTVGRRRSRHAVGRCVLCL